MSLQGINRKIVTILTDIPVPKYEAHDIHHHIANLHYENCLKKSRADIADALTHRDPPALDLNIIARFLGKGHMTPIYLVVMGTALSKVKWLPSVEVQGALLTPSEKALFQEALGDKQLNVVDECQPESAEVLTNKLAHLLQHHAAPGMDIYLSGALSLLYPKTWELPALQNYQAVLDRNNCLAKAVPVDTMVDVAVPEASGPSI